ncbi:conserved Plasmodium protein, unknown function [Plasmodium reichenowi]|uniref:Uncharacterized protein n=1 Tax=Plasmodium reichenowi TaxID=5854 RepID=A0A060RZW5_PLARE|nr:hypothetical protein PRSY57_1434500 [Plasmodium reichenowi]KYN94004.1 hypothetical protein PRSY57_1434500 [Plasmodium reichenowi]CDO66819.1 conserved Plasmodium protein, unknown function [Plasmodium reichenowi]
MGNITSEQKKKPLMLHELSTKIGDYRTIYEGDPEMLEDPDFPHKMMTEALNNNNTIDGTSVQGTFVYYPNKRKAKMWIGNYKILNPEDILCANVAEKIGITEMEWKKYIKRKKKNENDEVMKKNGNIGYNENPLEEPSVSLNDIIKKDNNNYNMNTNDNITNNLNRYMKTFNQNKNHPYNISNKNNSNIYASTHESNTKDDILVNQLQNNILSNEKDKEEKKKKSESRNSYIDKLNDEITNIREDQEKIIKQECKNIYKYTKSNYPQMIIPQEDGSFLIENVDPIKYNNKKKLIIQELLNEHENRFQSQVSNLKKKINKKGYTNLSSMSTKDSLGLPHIKNKETNISKRNIYLNRTLVK